MVFSSPLFLFYFLPVVLILYYLVPRGQIFWKNLVLLVGSLFFYAWGEPVYVLLMLFSIAMDYGLGLWLEHEKRRGGHPGRVLALAVVLNLLLLGFFKYANFLIGTVNGVTGAGLPLLEVSLPIGISFYTFQALSYIIDLYRGEVEVQRSILNFGTYVSLFPQLIAGPIVRMKTVAGELQDRQETFPDFAAGVRRFTVGLAKKVLLANTAGEIWQTVSGMETGKLPVLTAWIGLAAFTFQIYFDFSGYSDMAIGLGRMFGFYFPENFRYPYTATSITDFWRRWHITLSLWLRDYLYIPLGGSRRGNRYLNLIITMALGGLWHGSNIRFLVWGVMHGVGLAVVHAFHELKKRFWPDGFTPSPALHWCGVGAAWLLTFHFVSFLWVFFRAEDMERSLEILRRVFVFGQPGEGFPLLVIPAVLIGLALQLFGARLFAAFVDAQERLPWAVQAVVLALVGGFILKMGPDGVMPFIYFQF